MPQSKAYWKPAEVSADDGSDGLDSVRWKLVPSLTGPSLLKDAVGATLFTVTDAVYSVEPPSLSLILPLAVRVPLSLVGQDLLAVADQAP